MTERNQGARTSSVLPKATRLAIPWRWSVCLALTQSLGASAGGLADTTRVEAAQRSQAAESWLSLESDQRAERARAGTLSGSASRALQRRQQQDRLELDGTLSRQRRALEVERSFDGLRGLEAPRIGSGIRKQGMIQQQGRELDALRQRRQMRRGIGPGR